MVEALLITGLSVARERELGTFDQLLVSPLSPYEILIGKTIPAILVGVLEGLLLILAIFSSFTSLSKARFSFFSSACSSSSQPSLGSVSSSLHFALLNSKPSSALSSSSPQLSSSQASPPLSKICPLGSNTRLTSTPLAISCTSLAASSLKISPQIPSSSTSGPSALSLFLTSPPPLASSAADLLSSAMRDSVPHPAKGLRPAM